VVVDARQRNLGITKLKAFAEGVGTFLFVFTIGMTHLSHSFATARPLAGGAVYISMHYSLADVSGGYFNPAITLAMTMSRRHRCSFSQGCGYIIVQVISATFAAVAYTRFNDGRSFPVILDEASDKFGTLRICMAELLLMNITCLAFLANATAKGIDTLAPQNFYHGLAYGLSYAAGGFATYGLTGGVLNPSLAVGIGLADRFHHASHGPMSIFLRKCLCIAVFEFGGSVFAVLLFRWTHSREYRKHALDALDEESGEAKGEAQALLLSGASSKRELPWPLKHDADCGAGG
jgi:glycerol uptake facilitator-like aquaporin